MFNAPKVFVAGAVVGVIALQGLAMLTADARGPVCIIPFLPTASEYARTTDPEGATKRPCKCSECGKRASPTALDGS